MTTLTYLIKSISRRLRDLIFGWYWSIKVVRELSDGSYRPFAAVPWWFVKGCTAVGVKDLASDERLIVSLARAESQRRLMRRDFK